MRHSASNAALIMQQVEQVIGNAGDASNVKLHKLSATLHIIQGMALANEMLQRFGPVVQSGPFKGMKLVPAAMQGAFGPVLLGTYESELHGDIEQLVRHPYKQVLNIGCSFGYYTTGLALRMPNTTIYSYDIDPVARQNCLHMAALNDVGGRVKMGEEFKGEDFAQFADSETLVFMDIEGAELDLLNPQQYPALQKMDVVVELHDLFNGAISETIRTRFAPTHDIAFYVNRANLLDLSGLVPPDHYIDPIDHALLTWENRDGPTPWAVMRRKKA